MNTTSLRDRVRAKAAAATAATAGGAGEEAGAPNTHAHALDEAAEMDLTHNVLRWLEDRAGFIERALPDHLRGETSAFTMGALTYLRRHTGLLRCRQDSLLMALVQAAHFGLMPDGRQCAITPYGSQARFIPRAEGLIDLMYRSGVVTSVRHGLIYEADAWEINPTAPPPDDFILLTDRLNPDRGKPVLAYAFAWLRGGGRSEVITFNRAEVELHRDKYSWQYQLAERARDADPDGYAADPDAARFNSFWHTEFDAMWRKTPVRMLAKEVTTSPQVRLLLEADEAADAAYRQREPYRPVLPLNPADWHTITPTADATAAGDGSAVTPEPGEGAR